MKKQNMLYGMLIIACGMPGAYGGCPYSQPQCTSSYIQMLNNTSGFNRDNCTSYTNLCHSTVGMVGYIDCSSCKSGYKAVQKTYSTQMGCGNITVTECLPCQGCTNCNSYEESWAECQWRTHTKTCNCETCSEKIGPWRCDKNCYGTYNPNFSDSERAKRCKSCPGTPTANYEKDSYWHITYPTGMTTDFVNTDSGATKATQCYVMQGATLSDSTGTYTLQGKCYFSD